MTIRQARGGEAAVLARLHALVFPTSSWDEAFWKGALASPFDRAFLVGEAPQAFGLVRLLGEEAELLTIGTTAPRQGHGAALLAHIANAAGTEGARRLFLEVSAANKAALGLYRWAGFETFGTRERYYTDGTDALMMRLELVP